MLHTSNVTQHVFRIGSMQFRLSLLLTLIGVLLGTVVIFGSKASTSSELPDTKRVEKLISECQRRYPKPPWITVKEFLRRSKQEEWIIVDARSRREQDVSIIPGAIGKSAFKAQIDEHKQKNILIYCTVGCRSGAYAQRLRKKGFHAFNLTGGVLAWALEGKTFVTPYGNVTRRVHVYGRKWNALPPSYEAVW